MLLAILVYSILLFYLTWKNFRFGVGFFILLLPAYLMRFSWFGLPTTLLEVNLGILILVWLIKFAKDDWNELKSIVKQRLVFFIFAVIFLLAALGAVFVSGIGMKDFWSEVLSALGIWRAYFLEPIILFFVLAVSARKQRLSINDIVWFLLLSGAIVAILAIIQKFFGIWYPPSLWKADFLGKRATSFFTSPNALGMYLAPLFVLATAMVWQKIKNALEQNISIKIIIKNNLLLAILALLFIVAILFSNSQGACAAVVIAGIVIIYLCGIRRTAIVLALLSMSAALYFAPLRQAVFFADTAGQNRVQLWHYSIDYLVKNPQNFVLGTGLRQFLDKIQKPVNDFTKIEPLLYPHNFILNFWTEIGLFGMLAFLVMLGYLFFNAVKIYKNNKILGAGLIGLLLVWVVQGLVDVPYFKNDLSIMWWLYVLVLLF